MRSALRLLEDEDKKLQYLQNAIEEGENSGMIKDFDPEDHLRKIHKKHL